MMAGPSPWLVALALILGCGLSIVFLLITIRGLIAIARIFFTGRHDG